jgi:hypothetical protein
MLRLLYSVDITTSANAPRMRDMRGAGIRPTQRLPGLVPVCSYKYLI